MRLKSTASARNEMRTTISTATTTRIAPLCGRVTAVERIVVMNRSFLLAAECRDDVEGGRPKNHNEKCRENQERERGEHLERSRCGLSLDRLAPLTPQRLGRNPQRTAAASPPLFTLNQTCDKGPDLFNSCPFVQAPEGFFARHACVGLSVDDEQLAGEVGMQRSHVARNSEKCGVEADSGFHANHQQV